MKVLSLFSGCGGMDLGFEGNFSCHINSINTDIHPDWIESQTGDWVNVKKTPFTTVFANDIRRDAKAAWVSYFHKRHPDAESLYHLDSIVDLVKTYKMGGQVHFLLISMLSREASLVRTFLLLVKDLDLIH